MVRAVDIIHFQSVLSLINGSYIGKRKEWSDFFTQLNKLSFIIGDVLYDYRYRTRVGPFITDKDLAVKVTQAYKTIGSLNNRTINAISEHCLKSVPNGEFANNACQLYQDFTNQLLPLREGDWKLCRHIDKIESAFVEFTESFDRLHLDQSQLSVIDRKGEREVKADKLISESLAFFLFASFSYCDDMDIICQSLMRISKRLDRVLKPHDGVLPEDILEVMSRFPQPVYQGFIYYISKKKDVDDRAYTDLVKAVKNSNLDVFSHTIFEQKLYKEFLKYYDLLKLASSLIINEARISPSARGIYQNSIFLKPHICLLKVSDFYANYNQATDTRRIAAFTVAIFNEVKSMFADEHIQLISNLINSDEVVKERFSLYERVSQWHSTHPSASDNSTSQTTENSSVELRSDHNGDISTKEPPHSNEEFNCILPEKDIDAFLDYLVWMDYIKEGDQSSFKYDVFGGCKPTDYNTISFNFRKKSASTMLGIIIWQLRKEKNDPENLYGKKTTQSNSHIGIGEESMRIFVDFGLFFPSLINSLIVKEVNKKEINALINERLKERVRELYDSDDYKNCSSILEFIQQREIKDRKYWVVSKKPDN